MNVKIIRIKGRINWYNLPIFYSIVNEKIIQYFKNMKVCEEEL